MKKKKTLKNRNSINSQKPISGKRIVTQESFIGGNNYEKEHMVIKEKIDKMMNEIAPVINTELELKDLKVAVKNKTNKNAHIIYNRLKSIYSLVISSSQKSDNVTYTLKAKRGEVREFKTMENASKIVKELGFKQALITY